MTETSCPPPVAVNAAAMASAARLWPFPAVAWIMRIRMADNLPKEPAPGQLDDLRRSLDAIDEAILDRLAERRATVEQVLALKDTSGRALRDPDREAQMRAALVAKG